MTNNGTKPGHTSLCLYFQKRQWLYPNPMTSRFYCFSLCIMSTRETSLESSTNWLKVPCFSSSSLLFHTFLGKNIQDRLEIILNTWTEFGYVPSPAEVSKKEGIDIFNTKSEYCDCILTAFWQNELFQELGNWTENVVFYQAKTFGP